MNNVSRRMQKLLTGLGALALLTFAPVAGHAQDNAAKTEEAKTEETITASDTLRSYLQLQEQLHATQLALERNRKESEALAARNAEAVAARLQLIEQAMTAQRTRELEVVQSSNRLLLITAGSFAVVGFIAMLLTAYLQWRAVNRLADFTALLPATSRLPLPSAEDEAQLIGAGAAEKSSQRLFGALTQLEKRIHELEHTAQPALAEKPSAPPTAVAANGDQIHLLLAKGQSLLNLEKPDEALACYDEILKREPNHPEALVKKGVALEQLRQVEDALRCYDRAIAADGSLTVAYLQKGGLFNRLERYEEALQCYEQALRSQELAQGGGSVN